MIWRCCGRAGQQNQRRDIEGNEPHSNLAAALWADHEPPPTVIAGSHDLSFRGPTELNAQNAAT